MKKMTGAVVVLVVCIALYITSAVLLGAGITGGGFNVAHLAAAFRDIGLIGGILSGILVVTFVILQAVRNPKE